MKQVEEQDLIAAAGELQEGLEGPVAQVALGDFIDRARGAWMLATKRNLGAHVQSERAAIRTEVTMLAGQLDIGA